MTLLSPWWLLLLVPVALLAIGYLIQLRRRSAYAVRFATLPMLQRVAPRRPGWRRHLPATLLLVTFALLSVAAARPQGEVRVPRENATVMVVIDVSLSMAADDVEPSRIEAAQGAAADFVRGLPSGFNVGIVTFSGTTTVLTPPTTDYRRAATALEDLTLESRTAIGEGVFTSLRTLRVQEQITEADIPAHIVLLSDGRNTTGRPPADAARAAEAEGVPVSTIAYGTTDRSPVGIDTLADLADTSGGTAYTAEDGDELSAVYDDIRSSVGWRTELTELTPYVAAVALLAGLVAAALSLRWFVRLP